MLSASVLSGRLQSLVLDLPDVSTLEHTDVDRGQNHATPITAMEYGLLLDEQKISLSAHVGQSIRLKFLGQRSCGNCHASVNKLEGGGYCKNCFFSLARCDRCFVSPERCHFAQGTCREPQWGESYCMQPHVVYLANSSGPKVGITREDRSFYRWLSQGAVQGMVIAHAKTRRDAGLLEVAIKSKVSDKTNWRRMVSMQPQNLDLLQLARQLQNAIELPEGTQWVSEMTGHDLAYPIQFHAPAQRLAISETHPELLDNLHGIKGQYLLLSQGAFNVAAHVGMTVEVEFAPALEAAKLNTSDQLDLFS
ncbi:MAG: DUF2797 domain-containing protein [Pseudomonadales bacterium]|nr:DUF2797 domain-containing protein [Pseudomonadales bacterium]